MARSVAPRSKAPASEVTRPPSNAATSSRPPALPNAIPVALHCVGIGEHPPSGLSSFSQNKFYPFRDPDAPQSVEMRANELSEPDRSACRAAVVLVGTRDLPCG